MMIASRIGHFTRGYIQRSRSKSRNAVAPPQFFAFLSLSLAPCFSLPTLFDILCCPALFVPANVRVCVCEQEIMRRLLLLLLFFFLLLFAVHRLFLLFLLLLVVLCSVIVDCTWSPLFLFSFFAAVVVIAKRVMVSVSVIFLLYLPTSQEICVNCIWCSYPDIPIFGYLHYKNKKKRQINDSLRNA